MQGAARLEHASQLSQHAAVVQIVLHRDDVEDENKYIIMINNIRYQTCLSSCPTSATSKDDVGSLTE